QPKILTSQSDQKQGLVFSDPQSNGIEVELYYDRQSNRLSQTMVKVNGKSLGGQLQGRNKIKAIYSDYRDQITEAPLDHKMIFQKKGGKLIGLNEYAGYRFVIN
ncbi:MAG: hypothetical protein AAF242_16115, partial [Bacteroidota bacterium]